MAEQTAHAYAIAEGDVSDNTLTRSELERLRGGLSGNGHADLVAHHEAPALPRELPPLPPDKACKGCGASLAGRPRAVFCSKTCRQRDAYQHRSESSPAVGSLDSLTLARLLAIAIPEGLTFSVEVGGATVTATRE
jgi:hypothetical protein